LKHNTISAVISVEGIYVFYPNSSLLLQLNAELQENHIDIEDENLKHCDWILKGKLDKQGRLYHFKRNRHFPILSDLFCQWYRCKYHEYFNEF